jgi:hypothetical protein
MIRLGEYEVFMRPYPGVSGNSLILACFVEMSSVGIHDGPIFVCWGGYYHNSLYVLFFAVDPKAAGFVGVNVSPYTPTPF